MPRHDVCAVGEVTAGRITPVTVGRRTVLLTRLPSGEARAVLGRCPHQGAPLEFGCITGETVMNGSGKMRMCRQGEILRCPWHGFEFDLASGEPAVAAPGGGRMRLRFLAVETEGDRVVVVT